MNPSLDPNEVLAKPAATKSRRRGIISFVVGFVAMLLVMFFSAPLVLRSRKKSDQTEAVNNARQIGLALVEFAEEYGDFPSGATASEVRKKTASSLAMGTRTSNDFFRQLMGAGISQSEVPFYAKIKGVKRPDNRMHHAHQALEKGECGFSYLAGLSIEGNPSRPLLVTPLIPGTDRFDPSRFHGKAIVLSMDNSVRSIPIAPSGHVLIEGRNILDPAHPIWQGKPPKIKWPE